MNDLLGMKPPSRSQPPCCVRNGGGRVFADQDHGEAGARTLCAASASAQVLRSRRATLLRQGVAIEDRCGHLVPSNERGKAALARLSLIGPYFRSHGRGMVPSGRLRGTPASSQALAAVPTGSKGLAVHVDDLLALLRGFRTALHSSFRPGSRQVVGDGAEHHGVARRMSPSS